MKKRQPWSINTLLDLPRVLPEALKYAKNLKDHTNSNRGKDHIVITLPGFASNDVVMSPVNKFFKLNGYTVYGWGQGINTGIELNKIQQASLRIQEIAKRHNKKVHLVGHSLGGIYSREIARACPDVVDSVTTLGSPFNDLSSNRLVWLYKKIMGEEPKELQMIAPLFSIPLQTRTMNVFSQRDGVVHWKSCFNPKDKNSTPLEVISSHVSMLFDLEALCSACAFIRNPVDK